MIFLNYSTDTSRMVAYHYSSLDKNGQMYGHGWNLNVADIECIYEGRGNLATILSKYHTNDQLIKAYVLQTPPPPNKSWIAYSL